MPIYRLSEFSLDFPDPDLASADGILAVGGDLSPERLLVAYQLGIFPWFNEGDPILWWSPDPRFVLFPEELKVSKSMRPYFNQKKFEICLDQRFETVMQACRMVPRRGQMGGSWITQNMIKAYSKLHEMGFAHSVEVLRDGELVGGLYGISIGKCFFGESMFALESNASKFGFIWLVKALQKRNFWMVDCQQATRHLGTLGARSIDRHDFLDLLHRNRIEKNLIGSWKSWPETEEIIL